MDEDEIRRPKTGNRHRQGEGKLGIYGRMRIQDLIRGHFGHQKRNHDHKNNNTQRWCTFRHRRQLDKP
eukprot:4200371-Ditylum_brightwellii.AAC.1